jgi:hypothetical protein
MSLTELTEATEAFVVFCFFPMCKNTDTRNLEFHYGDTTGPTEVFLGFSLFPLRAL